MSVQGLMDHTVTVHRLTETTDAGGEQINSYVDQLVVEPLALVPPKERRTDLGAGDVNRGILEGYARADADIIEEDVLNVITGPEAPRQLRVLTKTKPRGNHLELTFERFTGSLT